MKRNIFKALIIALALPAMFIMTSCKEQPNSKELYLYLNTEVQPINRIDMSVDVEIHSTGNVVKTSGTDSLVFPLKANRSLPAGATCTVGVDPSKLAQYNKENADTAKLLPESYVSISNGGKISIGAGQMVGTDSLEVRVVGDFSKLDVKNPTYVCPLTILSISSDDRGLVVSSNLSTIYVVVKVEVSLFNMSVTDEAGMTGNPIDQTSVVVSGTTSPARLTDGKTTPAWNPTQSTSRYAIFDLKAEKDITGFRTWPGYQYPGETIKRCGIEVSNDGTNWLSQGNVELAPPQGDKTNPVWQYTKFDEPIKYRYVRLKSLSTYDPSGGYTGLSEFQLYIQ